MNYKEHGYILCVQIDCIYLFLLSQDLDRNGEQYDESNDEKPNWAQLSRLDRRHFLKQSHL